MKAFKDFWNGSKQNKLFALLVILLCLGAIEFTTHLFTPAPVQTEQSSHPVAVVQTVQTDVRQQPYEEKSWYRAEPQTEVMKGDTIYSGRNSASNVQMKSGGILELGEDTLVIFDDVDSVTIPDATRGLVKLKITGNMKIAISGQLSEFTSAQSDLVLNPDGTVRARGKGISIRDLTTGQEMALPPKLEKVVLPKIEIPKAAELAQSVREKRKTIETPPVQTPTPTPPPPVAVVPPPPPPPEPVKVKEPITVEKQALNVDRIMKVQEVYERKGDRRLVPRSGVKFIKVPVALKWKGSEPDENVVVQVSKDKSFAKPWIESEAAGSNVIVNQWKPGKNYWRISRDRQTWTPPTEIVVNPIVAPKQKPTLSVLNKNVVVYPPGKGPEAQAKLLFQDRGLPNPRGWVLQGSSSPKFEPRTTKTVFVSDSRVDIPLKKPGRYFFRVRSVAGAGEISTFSGPIEVNAAQAVAPVVKSKVAKQEKKKEEERKVAAVEEKKEEPVAKETAKVEVEEKPDMRPRPWSIAIEGGETALVSSEQIATSGEFASMHMIGLRGIYANEKHFASVAFRSKFGAMNPQGESQGKYRFETKYTRWWQSWLRPVHLGWTGSFEMYRNPPSPQFSKGYDSLKTGLGVAIRVNDKWKTGGDILLGTWFDQSKFYEIGGFISYDFTRITTLGVGYRLSLFDAGSSESSPVELPYREAMGEAYSSLKFGF